ncbi:hypothetical protein [Paenibacillus glucanolyticus]|uniref:hypothetical protein n=1 Tax=Paenibacillus glucanolyticus TaxID=59843 RepID=UPI00096ED025|nr:hypothetical protein [Paenibacillus glucanolyticus]OMF70460.1 hypothetical protein BK142_23580 [Paenibacillus glucanolyticus]
MTCPICRYETGEGKYCKKCGARLIIEESPVFAAMKEQAAASEVYSINRTSVSSKGDRPQTNQGEPALPVYTPPDIPFQTAGRQHGEEAEEEPNPYWTSLKLYGQLYGEYFLKGIKHPFSAAVATDSSQFLNAMVTMLLYVLLLPLTIYATLHHELQGLPAGAFAELVVKPVIWIALFMFLLNVFTYAAVKLSFNPAVKLKEVMARFGTLLTLFLMLYVVSLLFLFLNGDISKVIILLSFISTLMTVPLLVMTSYKRRMVGGLDPLYAILLVYVAVMLVIVILGNSMIGYITGF